MRERIDVHGAKERYTRVLEAVKKDQALSDYNRKKIIQFVWDLQAEGITLVRQTKYLYLLPKLAKQRRHIMLVTLSEPAKGNKIVCVTA